MFFFSVFFLVQRDRPATNAVALHFVLPLSSKEPVKNHLGCLHRHCLCRRVGNAPGVKVLLSPIARQKSPCEWKGILPSSHAVQFLFELTSNCLVVLITEPLYNLGVTRTVITADGFPIDHLCSSLLETIVLYAGDLQSGQVR